MKNVYKFLNKHDIPWVGLVWNAYYADNSVPAKSSKGSFWWRDVSSLISDFKSYTDVNTGYGDTVSLWHDLWSDEPIQELFPQLFSFAKNKEISYRQAAQAESIFDMFSLPLSQIAEDQANLLTDLIDRNGAAHNVTHKDKWSFHWGGEKYSTKKVYLQMVDAPDAPNVFKWIWKSCVLSKQKFFYWLMIQNRVNTKERMVHKSFFVQNDKCVLCDEQVIEDREHLFFECDFSRNFWWKLNHEWNNDLNFLDMIMDGKQRRTLQFFNESVILGSWSLWNHRNNIIFDNQERSMDTCFSMFSDYFKQIIQRAKPGLKEGMQDWLDLL
jgi:hypothetical protein